MMFVISCPFGQEQATSQVQKVFRKKNAPEQRVNLIDASGEKQILEIK